MWHRRASLAIALSLLWAGCALGQNVDDDSLLDESFLRAHGIRTDAASLMSLLRNQAVDQVVPANLDDLVRQLGDARFETRERAARELIAFGPSALAGLRKTTAGADLEIGRRKSLCIDAIEARQDRTLGYYAVRVLERTHPSGSAAALLHYLPAADAETVTEVWLGVEGVARVDGTVDPAFRAALTDADPRRRALAAFVLARHGTSDDRTRACLRLDDKDTEVRLRAAQGLLAAWDRRAVPALIALLQAKPLDVAWQAQELLHWLAGDAAPAVVVGDGSQGRECAAAWQRWWRDAGPRLDWERVGRSPRRPGLVLVCDDERVWLCGADGKSRWALPNSAGFPDAQMLPGPRLLLHHAGERRVLERGIDGKEVWTSAQMPTQLVGCQRLANGNTLVFGQDLLIELGLDGKTVSSNTYGDDLTVLGATRLRNGTILARVVGEDCELAEFDDHGQVLGKLGAASDQMSVNASLLAATTDGTVYYCTNGSDMVCRRRDGGVAWRRLMPGANSLDTLPGGNLLVADQTPPRLYELTPAGHVAWEVLLAKPPAQARDAFPLLRLGFDPSRGSDFDLNSVTNRTRDLRNPEPKMRRLAAAALAARGPEAKPAVAALIDALADEDGEARALVHSALVAVGSAAVPDLLAATRGKPDPIAAEVYAVLEMLGIEAKSATATLVTRLEDQRTESWERQAAASVLAAIGPDARAATPALIAALQGENDAVRNRAAVALGRIGGKVVAPLLDALKDTKHRSGRVGAAIGLASLGPAAHPALPALVEIMSDRTQDMTLRLATTTALGHLDNEGRPAVGPLAAVLHDHTQPTMLRDEVARSLCQLRQVAAPALPVFLDILCDPAAPPQIAASALQAVSNLGPQMNPCLVRLLAEGTPPARRLAVRQFRNGNVNGADALPVLQVMAASDPDPQLRQQAQQAIRYVETNVKRRHGDK